MAKSQSKIFEGIYREQMPLLREAGLKPLTAEQVVKKRLAGELSFDVYYDTSTGIFYAGNNQDKFKILPYSQDLASITRKTSLYYGGIKKTAKAYKSVKNQEFTREDMILGKRITEKEALVHQGWLASLNSNKKLLERVVQQIFKEVKDRYKENKAMGFYLGDVQEKPNIRALYLDKLYYWRCCRADANDGHELYWDLERLVGISKSARATSQK